MLHGAFDDVLGLAGFDPSRPGAVDFDGRYLGAFGHFQLFLTDTASDGNDLVIVAIPQPAACAMICVAGMFIARRRPQRQP